MATTRIMPLHVGKGRTESRAISEIIDYVANPQKTDHGRLITGYECDSRVADAQFLLDKQTYAARTGRMRGADDVIAYHLRQSFVPGEITPEEANRLGVELARRFTKGKHAFIVCTHIDKSHTHNHIIWNSTTLECDRKFRNFWGSTRAVHRLSDTICIENGYSIVEAPKRRGQSYNKWLGDAAKLSHKEQLRQAIDRALAQKPGNLEELLRLLEQDGFTVHRRGKTISISAEGWGNNVRFDRLGDGYTLDDLLAFLSGQKEHTPRKKTAVQAATPRVNLLVDIQAKLQAGKGAGYARWAKVFNLKQMAQTLNYLSRTRTAGLCRSGSQNSRGDGSLQRAVRPDQGRREAHGRDRRAAHPHRQLCQDPRDLCGLPQGRVFKEIPAGTRGRNPAAPDRQGSL